MFIDAEEPMQTHQQPAQARFSIDSRARIADWTRTRVRTGVGELYVEKAGSGPAVLCWPSLFCDGRTLSALANELALDHCVLVVDGPGHGRSGSPAARFTFEESAAAAISVLDAAGLPRAAIVGSAWGGHVGVQVALSFADRLSGLVVMNAPLEAWAGLQRLKMWASYQAFRLLGARDFLVDAVAAAMLSEEFRARDPQRAGLIVDCLKSSPQDGLALAMRCAMLDRPSLVGRLPEIRVPALFIAGDRDPLFPVEMARRQALAVPGARFEVVEGTAHLSAMEDPERVSALVRSFLESLAS
jgi:pimeloyl-ACP methyl ester carboxylesterase